MKTLNNKKKPIVKNKLDLVFDRLVETMHKYDLYQINEPDEVADEIANVRKILDEVRNRMFVLEVITTTIIEAIRPYQDAVDAGNPFTMDVQHFDRIQTGGRDILTLVDFNDTTPVEENWSGVFIEKRGKYGYHSFDGSNLSVIRLSEENDLSGNTYDDIMLMITSLPELQFTLHEDLVNEELREFYIELGNTLPFFHYSSFDGVCKVINSEFGMYFNCTPFWSDNENVDIQICNGDKLVHTYKVGRSLPKRLDNIAEFKIFYTILVKDLISKL